MLGDRSLFSAEQKEYLILVDGKSLYCTEITFSTDTVFDNIYNCSIHSVSQSYYRLVNILKILTGTTVSNIHCCSVYLFLSQNN